MNRLREKKITGLSSDALTAFMQYDWPGNIRELENAIEHAFVLCHGGFIEHHHLPRVIREIEGGEKTIPQAKTLAEIEAHAIYETLARHNWKRLATARELGINKTTLWRKMKRFKLEFPRQNR